MLKLGKYHAVVVMDWRKRAVVDPFVCHGKARIIGPIPVCGRTVASRAEGVGIVRMCYLTSGQKEDHPPLSALIRVHLWQKPASPIVENIMK